MPFRSLLFTPANRLDRMAKGLSAGPDWLALDLEDGVLENQKDEAREMVKHHFATNKKIQTNLAIRINSLSTSHGIKDMHSMLAWKTWPGMIIVPKVDNSIQIQQIRDLAVSSNQEPYIIASLETALGLESATEILSCGDPKLVAAYGSADHTAQTGSSMEPEALAWARGRIVNAAATAKLPVMDGVWLDYKDLEGLRKESEICRSMGFSGKIAIHPCQIETINDIFTPSDKEIDEAIQMLKAAEESGSGVFSFNGKMVDLPILAKARQIAGIEKRGKHG